jgi:hypothetical protein
MTFLLLSALRCPLPAIFVLSLSKESASNFSSCLVPPLGGAGLGVLVAVFAVNSVSKKCPKSAHFYEFLLKTDAFLQLFHEFLQFFAHFLPNSG